MSSALEDANVSDSPTLLRSCWTAAVISLSLAMERTDSHRKKPVIYVTSYEDDILAIFLLALSILGLTGLNERLGLAGLFSDGCGPHLKGRLDHIDAHHGEGQGHTAQPHTWP
jgi:hypothetical protein